MLLHNFPGFVSYLSINICKVKNVALKLSSNFLKVGKAFFKTLLFKPLCLRNLNFCLTFQLFFFPEIFHNLVVTFCLCLILTKEKCLFRK